MGKFRDLTNMKFNKLHILERAENDKFNKPQWKCVCECGNEIIVKSQHLINGNTKSCGCLRKINHTKKHNLRNTEHYSEWKGMKNRCANPNNTAFKNYGGRGITVCDEWKNDFEAFYNYVSKLPHFNEIGYTLDRINNDGNYEPNNVRWATRKQQRANQRGAKNG